MGVGAGECDQSGIGFRYWDLHGQARSINSYSVQNGSAKGWMEMPLPKAVDVSTAVQTHHGSLRSAKAWAEESLPRNSAKKEMTFNIIQLGAYPESPVHATTTLAIAGS